MIRQFKAFTLVVLAIGTTTAQSNQQQKTSPESSTAQTLLLIASQPLSPIRIESARVAGVPGRANLAISFELRNVADKPIRSVTPVLWTSLHTGGTQQPQPENGILEPGEVLKISSAPQNLANEHHYRLKPEASVNALIVLLVEEVMFADGTTYSDHVTSKALLSYFEKISDKVGQRESFEQTENKLAIKFPFPR